MIAVISTTCVEIQHASPFTYKSRHASPLTNKWSVATILVLSCYSYFTALFYTSNNQMRTGSWGSL